MGRRNKASPRCMRCRMIDGSCVCAHVPRLHPRTRVVVVMHRREWPKTTATAHLAAQAMPEAVDVRLRGDREHPLDLSDLADPARRPLLLFPSDDARTLSPELLAEDPRPVTLVVPDGSWRQASKVHKREPALAGVPRVVLPDLGPSRYELRQEPRDDGLATFEAISRALGILDGPHIREPLDALFDVFVARTLESRGVPVPGADDQRLQ